MTEQPLNSYQSRTELHPNLQPSVAWLAILMLIVGTATSLLVGLSSILNLAFPAGALAVGVFLYFKHPLLYVGFTWWIWLLTPLVRRFADYQSRSFTDPSPILLAPYLVTFISLLTVLRHLPYLHRRGGLPFIVAMFGLLYGFSVGLVQRDLTPAVIGLLDWLTPVLFGFHLFTHWRDYPSYRQNTQRVFIYAVLLLGIYAIYQYLTLPAWDEFWMMNAPINSIGRPEALQFRAWSTLNSGEPFAAFMAVALLLIFSYQGTLSLPTMLVGYVSFLLTMVRTAWGGWFLGLLFLLSSVKPRLQIRFLMLLSIIVLVLIPLAGMEDFSERITERIETFSNLEADPSANTRKSTYQRLFSSALLSFFGGGIGGPRHDSNFLSLLLDLGWFGTIFYGSGLLIILITCFQNSNIRFDPFLAAVQAAIVSILVRVPFNSSFLGMSGILLWSLLAINLAANRYHSHQISSHQTNSPQPTFLNVN